jgi:hypothetical protein
VVSVLRGLPGLDGAACRGLGGMWDGDALPGEEPDDPDARLTLAVRVCRRCPARWAYAVHATRYRPDQLDGVWAGRLRTRAGRGAA